MFASKSLAESGLRPLLYADSRAVAGRLALNRAGRSYVITWRVDKNADGEECLVDRRAHHPDDLVEPALSREPVQEVARPTVINNAIEY